MRRLLLACAVLAVLALVLSPIARRRDQSVLSPYNLDDGVLRAVVLGDSVGHGTGDESGRGLAGWLALELRGRTAGAVESLNLALDGARTSNIAARLRESGVREAIRRADLVVISIGGNDLYGDSRARLLSRVWPWAQRHRTLERVEGIIQAAQRLNPAAQICLLGLYNPYRHTRVGQWIDTQVNRWDGGAIGVLAAEERVTVVRIADLLRQDGRLSPIDHFHPGARGYSAIARRIADTL